jgi:hypothetical protein
MINIRGKHVFPLVTGTFGGVDFVHSVLGLYLLYPSLSIL